MPLFAKSVYVRPAALACFCYLLFYSCKIDCTHPHIDEARVLNYNAAVDSFARIVRYKKGNGLAVIVDTINEKLNGQYLEYFFEENYDYKVTIMPRGKLHVLKEISYGSEKITKSPGNDPGSCSSSASYNVDDSVFKLPYLNYDGTGRHIVIDLR